jgi:hypothetical protein
LTLLEIYKKEKRLQGADLQSLVKQILGLKNLLLKFGKSICGFSS